MAKSKCNRQWDWQSARYADLSHPEWYDERVPDGFWNDVENHRRYLTWLGRKLNFKKLDDWYRVRSRDFEKNRGFSVLNRYQDRPSQLLAALFPNHPWKPWKFVVTPRGFWRRAENRKKYVSWLARELSVKKPSDWYQFTYRDFAERYGLGLLGVFKDDLLPILQEHYPRFHWQPWRFRERRMGGFWRLRKNRVTYMKWLGKELKFKTLDDWYSISHRDFAENCGGRLLKRYRNSPTAIVVDCFPQRKWLMWKFANAPNDFWKKKSNRVEYMKWLGKQLSFKTWEDWYSITKHDYSENFGGSLLQYAEGSPPRPVLECFANAYDWLPWRFNKTPRGYWQVREHRVRYMNWLGKHLGYRRKEDWYQLRSVKFYRNHGQRLWLYYEQSAFKALKDFRPNYNWDKSRCSS